MSERRGGSWWREALAFAVVLGVCLAFLQMVISVRIGAEREAAGRTLMASQATRTELEGLDTSCLEARPPTDFVLPDSTEPSGP